MDDPHDSVSNHNLREWCRRCQDEQEMCDCDRHLPPGSGFALASFLGVIFFLFCVVVLWAITTLKG